MLLVTEGDEITEHQLEVEDVATKYNTVLNYENPMQSQGLDGVNIIKNREKFGLNAQPEVKKPSIMRAYFNHLNNLFSLILILCGILSLSLFAVYYTDFTHLYVGLVLIAVAFLNAFLEFYQKYKSEELLKSFLKMIPDNAFVIREGAIQEILASQIVMGDLLVLRTGDKIAADCRLFHVSEMKVDNSILTGESEPVERDQMKAVENCSVFDAKNIVFNGTTVSAGEGIGIVIRIGSQSAIGKLSQLAESSEVTSSQLTQEMDVAVRILVTSGLTIGTTLMIISFAQGFGLAVSFEIAIGSFLAFLPQGLPATITILLTIAAKRMAKKNVLVKNLQGVETLGAITLLATDKTGTLTMNRMEAVSYWIEGTEVKDLSIEDLNLSPEILNVCQFCSNIKILPGDVLLGDATEQGLYRLMKRFNRSGTAKRLFEIPFSSATKWHLVIEEIGEDEVVLMKGAPEKVFQYCKYYKTAASGDVVEIDENYQKSFESAYDEMGRKGLRVIAFATKILPSNMDLSNFDEYEDLIFLGLIGLQDPPKVGVVDTMRKIRRAGIRVVMITGDHPITAEAISRQIGILNSANDVVRIVNEATAPSHGGRSRPAGKESFIIHGEMIEKIEKKMWDRIVLSDEIIFARTQPKHKLQIVKKFQEYGHVVAVVGDGANDSPALKIADLGISMNRTASDVSKEAADMILLDDDFNTIVTGIREGRLIFENLKKSIRYTLTHIFPEISSLATVAICGLAFPFPALLILVFDVFCEIGPAMSFSTEMAPIDFLRLKPRKIPRLKLEEVAEEDTEAIVDKNANNVKIEGERLIDTEMVFWTFLQGGIFLAIGCFSAYLLTMIWNDVALSSLWRSVDKYFDSSIGVDVQPLTLTTGEVIDASQQEVILEQAQSAFFLSLVLGQWFNLFLTKHRYKYPHGWDIFKNPSTYLGMATSATISCIVVFVPGIQVAFNTESIVAVAIAPPIVTGTLLVLYEYPRRWIYFRMRKRKGNFRNDSMKPEIV